MKLMPFAALGALLIVVGCGAPPPVGRIGVVGPPSVAAGDVLTYSLHKIENSNVVAYTYLMPQGWSNDDKVVWTNVSNIPYPITQLVTTSPDKQFVIAEYPVLVGSWQTGPMGSNGEAYQNASEAIDATMQKDQQIQNYQVVSTQHQAAQSSWTAMGAQGEADNALTRCTYTENGVEKEALIVGKLDTGVLGTGGMESKIWHLSLQIMAAPRGQLMTNQAFLKQAATFFASAQITPEFNKMISDASFTASQESRKIALQEEDDMMKRYWDQQKNMEQGVKNFDDYIRGVQNYTNPSGGPPLSLPAGGNYWIDPQGNVQQAPDDPNYDPNRNGGNWSHLQQNPG